MDPKIEIRRAARDVAEWVADKYLSKLDTPGKINTFVGTFVKHFQDLGEEEKERAEAEQDRRQDVKLLVEEAEGQPPTFQPTTSSGVARQPDLKNYEQHSATSASTSRGPPATTSTSSCPTTGPGDDETPDKNTSIKSESSSAEKQKSVQSVKMEVDWPAESETSTNQGVPDLDVGRVAEDVYVVKRIVDGKTHRKDGKLKFLVEWDGWPSEYNSWVAMDDLDCPELIQEYFKTEAEKVLQLRASEDEEASTLIGAVFARARSGNVGTGGGATLPGDYYLNWD